MTILVISHTSFVFAQDLISFSLGIEIKPNPNKAVLKRNMKKKLEKVSEPVRVVKAGIIIGKNVDETVNLK